jgi:hypothetical protein
VVGRLDHLQRGPQLRRRLVSLASGLGEAALDHLVKRSARPSRVARKPIAHDGGGEIDRCSALEGPRAGRHLVEDDADAPHIRALICALAAEHFWRHVRQRACNVAAVIANGGLPRGCSGLHCPVCGRPNDHGEAEIENLQVALGCHDDVSTGQISMHDVSRVCVGDRLGDLQSESDHAWQGETVRWNQFRKRATRHVLHDDEHVAVVLADFMDRADVGMIQRGKYFRFALQGRETINVIGRSVQQNLECDIASEPGVVRDVHGAHAPPPDERADIVVTESLSRFNSHAKAV